MNTYAARNSDDELHLFYGVVPPETYRVDGFEHGGEPAVAYRDCRGCSLVAKLRPEMFRLVRLGECRVVREDDSGVAA